MEVRRTFGGGKEGLRWGYGGPLVGVRRVLGGGMEGLRWG